MLCVVDWETGSAKACSTERLRVPTCGLMVDMLFGASTARRSVLMVRMELPRDDVQFLRQMPALALPLPATACHCGGCHILPCTCLALGLHLPCLSFLPCPQIGIPKRAMRFCRKKLLEMLGQLQKYYLLGIRLCSSLHCQPLNPGIDR